VRLTDEEYREMEEEPLIAWTDIVAECDNYKDGLVAVFRKYEGELTDELDGRGAPQKVSQNSFADHLKIPRETFKRWVRNVANPAQLGPDQKQARTAASHANVVKNMAKNDPAALVAAIESAGVSASDQVFHEHKLHRAGVDTSPAARKAANATAHAIARPMQQAIAETNVTLCVSCIDEATEYLQAALDEDAVGMRAVNQITKALEAFQSTLAEASFRVS
jgi:hypothetical protein